MKSLEEVREYIESMEPIALPGGTWCYFCGVELCRNITHNNNLRLQRAIMKLLQEKTK